MMKWVAWVAGADRRPLIGDPNGADLLENDERQDRDWFSCAHGGEQDTMGEVPADIRGTAQDDRGIPRALPKLGATGVRQEGLRGAGSNAPPPVDARGLGFTDYSRQRAREIGIRRSRPQPSLDSAGGRQSRLGTEARPREAFGLHPLPGLPEHPQRADCREEQRGLYDPTTALSRHIWPVAGVRACT